jgi:hypothetical protein
MDRLGLGHGKAKGVADRVAYRLLGHPGVSALAQPLVKIIQGLGAVGLGSIHVKQDG